MKIKDLPVSERPREKAFRYGVDSLSNVELLAIIIGSGTRDFSALDIANKLVNENHGLFNLSNVAFQNLSRVKGLNKIKALMLASSFELYRRLNEAKFDETLLLDSREIFLKYSSKLSQSETESFILLMFDKKKRIIKELTLLKGANESFSISFKEILMELLLNKASYYVVVHNHPSGEESPSHFDIMTTYRLKKETEEVGIHMYDHLIVSYYKYYSFREDGFSLVEIT